MATTSLSGVRTALAAYITTSGITCYAYEDYEIPPTPVATLTLGQPDIGEMDQAYGWSRLRFVLRNYRLLEGNAQVGLAAMDTDMQAILTTLGSDRTINGLCVDSTVESVDVSFETRGTAQYAVAEWTLSLGPFFNA